MIELFCGIIIGIVMGLTGAGGALVAIPLFMQFMGQSLKEASLYSLVAVVFASLFNYLAQRSFTQYKTGLIIITASAVGSYLTTPFKEALPAIWIAVILTFLSLYALFNIWFPKKIKPGNETNPSEKYFISILVGLILGALTTFTGLGGGVLILPILIGLYGLSQQQAVATGLFTVGLSSISSLIIQINHGAKFEMGAPFIYLLGGILLVVIILKKLTSKIKPPLIIRIRQIVFSLVVALALLKIY